MTTFNNQDLQSKFDENGYIAINPLFSIDKIEEIKIELSRYIKDVSFEMMLPSKINLSASRLDVNPNWPKNLFILILIFSSK